MIYNVTSSSLIPSKQSHTLKMPIVKFMKSRLLFLFVLFSLSISGLAYSQAVDSSVKIINSDTSGVTLEFGLSGLDIKNKEFNNTYYNLISYKDCIFTSDTGKPKLPNSQVFLGVPPSVSVSVNIVDSAYTDAFGYTPNPVPNIVSRKSNDGLESLVEEFVIDKEFYRQNTLYPVQNAKIVYEGNFRHQRVVILELCPIQYNPALKLLRKYTKLVVRVNFSGSKLAPSISAKNKVRDVEFENSYKSLLLNYESAKDWRGNSSFQKAPASQNSPKTTEQALKIFVGQKGIYKLDYAMLKGAGIDPSTIDPRTFKIRFLDTEVPIYVHGEADGKFNTADYVEFFGVKPTNIYTRWNTYWLTWGGDKGIRMVQKSGVPSSPTATEVTFFKSKVYFEEDHRHHKLQHSFSDPNDPDSWFESRDHWFWTGVENGSPKNEVTINFPVYDLAQSLSKPDFKIELVGCTNFAHEAMISVNGFRAGEEAKWNSQDIYSFDGQIPIDALKEGFDNVLRLSRIGTDSSDGSDMDSYPYQFYLNWFELGYFRKLIAVNDSLEFSSPEEKVAKPLFNISLDNKTSLDKGKIPLELSQKLRNTNVTLSGKAVLSVLETGIRWMVTDNQQTYLIKKEIDKLSVYSNEINDYTVSGFLDNDVEIFQISSDNAVSRFKDVVVKEYKLNQDDKNRIKKIIMDGVSNDDKFSTLVPPSNGRTYPKIPDVGYSATFEDDSGQASNYIAVTASSVLQPDRIELDVLSNLKETSNHADYIIISHPKFIDVAKKLADWRSSAGGGSFVTRVIDVNDVYDEFGNGMVSPHAIKDFLTYAYNNWTQPAPSYVLLFGDATYDFLGIDEKTYEEAPELIGFIPSFYIKTTFGQTAVDHWYSAIDGNDGFPDVHLGRIAVEEVEEAENAVEKIIANESGRINGQWRKQIVSIADDDSYAAGDEIFQEGLEDIYKYHTPVAYDTEKIYLKDIIQQVQQNPSEKRIPADVTQSMIMDSFANGSVISQYSGHGGRHVWAHEIILSITDIENLKETETYPFLMVFSCYNGYFDVPGELCMAEGMLRAKKKGVVAMFSATRLTYGPGNVSLNNFMFDSIFKDKIRRIGQAVSIAKTRVVKEEGVMWLSQMYQYTLFGDPASKLSLPDYEVYPKTANASVSPGGKLDVASGQVVKSVDGQPVNTNGNMTATMIFPDGSKDVKSVSIVNGVFPAVSYNIPKSMTAGKGVLKLYGQNGSESVVGGMEFSISQPYFANISHEITDDKLQIYAKIDDDVDSSNLVPPSNGRTELKSVILIWNMSSGENESPMIFDQEKKAYKIQEPIKLSFQSKDISYRIKVTDVDGNLVTSDQMSIYLPYKPNLMISRNSDNSETNISYTYSNLFDKWGLDVDVLNASNTALSLPVRVMIFDGNPDQNNDKIVDKNAKILAETTIKDSDWTPLSDQQTQTASIFMPCSLSMGRQMIFAWIDPVTDVSQSNFGVYDEENENDNTTFKIIDVTHALLAPGQGASTKSIDNVFQVATKTDSVKQNSVISIENVNDINIPSNQPSISFVTFSGGNKEGYILSDSFLVPPSNGRTENKTGKTSPATNFDKPISVKMRFDLLPLKEEIKKELGLNEIPDSQLETEQLDVIEKTLEDRVSNVGVYLWYESAKRWARLPSTAVLDDKVQTFLIGDVKKTGNGIVSLIYTDENANTPVDDWNISFIDSDHFNVAGNKTGIIKKDGQIYSGTVGDEFYDNVTGIHIKIISGLIPFSSYDRLTFKTIETGIIEAESQWSGIFSLMLNNDSRPPNIKIDVADQNFADGDVVSSEPKIHALVSDDNGIDLLYRNIDILMSLDAGEFEPAKQEDYIFNWEPSSNDVAVNFAPGKLEPGSYEVKIQAYDLNGNLGVRSIKFEVKSEFEIEEKSLMNYPNPFERETDVVFQLTSVADDAIVKIYTVSGRLIKTLEDQNVINFVTIHWDGRDEDGKEVANGVYYYKLRLKRQGRKDIVETGKMLKLK